MQLIQNVSVAKLTVPLGEWHACLDENLHYDEVNIQVSRP